MRNLQTVIRYKLIAALIAIALIIGAGAVVMMVGWITNGVVNWW